MVFDLLALCEVDGVFADVRCKIRDALDVSRHQQQLDRLRDCRWMLHHPRQQHTERRFHQCVDSIARALANDPEVLLLDEPASALDPIATQRIEELLYELRKELTVVIVTHNLQQAARIANYTAFFLLGHLVEAGPTEQVFTRPREERTEAYVTGRFG